jgi:8-amino-3,8-dideoxy-alpha-D-manno-octulosonate transaminase
MPGYELFGKEEQAAVNEVFTLSGGVLFAHGFDGLRNGIFKVREYEREFALKFGFDFGQAVSSGTAAIHVALKAAGIKPGDEVITQAHTYIATVEGIMSVGAIPVIVDIDNSLNMCSNSFAAAITRKTKAVMPVHMLGDMANMVEIVRIAEKHNLIVIEDCAQGLGASIENKVAGSYSLVSAFSTDAGKTLNTGEGGMVLTNKKEIYELSRAIHDHGHSYKAGIPRGLDPAMSLGFNYRMSELNAAVGLAQLRKFDLIVRKQRENRQKLAEKLAELSGSFRRTFEGHNSAGDTLVLFSENAESATLIANKLKNLGIGTKNLPDAMRWHFSKHWEHLVGYNKKFDKAFKTGWKDSALILEKSVAIGISVKWNDDDIEKISKGILSAWS